MELDDWILQRLLRESVRRCVLNYHAHQKKQQSAQNHELERNCRIFGKGLKANMIEDCSFKYGGNDELHWKLFLKTYKAQSICSLSFFYSKMQTCDLLMKSSMQMWSTFTKSYNNWLANIAISLNDDS